MDSCHGLFVHGVAHTVGVPDDRRPKCVLIRPKSYAANAALSLMKAT